MHITGLTNSYTGYRLKNLAKPSGFYLAAWRVDGQQIVIDSLRVDLPINLFDWPRRKARIRPANIISCEASWPPLPPTESWESPSVTLLKWLTPNPDPDLLACKELMLHPPAIMECSFGTLHRDERFDHLKGSVDWDGKPIEIIINGEFGADASGQAKAITSILADQSKWKSHMSSIIKKEYRDWHDTWGQDNKEGISFADYASHLTLEAIEMSSPTMLSFWLDDGGFYGGHAIELQGNPDTSFDNFALQG